MENGCGLYFDLQHTYRKEVPESKDTRLVVSKPEEAINHQDRFDGYECDTTLNANGTCPAEEEERKLSTRDAEQNLHDTPPQEKEELSTERCLKTSQEQQLDNSYHMLKTSGAYDDCSETCEDENDDNLLEASTSGYGDKLDESFNAAIAIQSHDKPTPKCDMTADGT